MRCLKPREVGFQSDGKTIAWSEKTWDKQYASFKLPCGQCLECRLEYARQWSIRCVHESKMHPENAFITLTYRDEDIGDSKLHYEDFQEFIKRLRDHIFRETTEKYFGKGYWSKLSQEEKKAHLNQEKQIYERSRIGFFVTGEYGGETKRPHWHAIIFNWYPPDAIHKWTNERGDRLHTSEITDRLWGKGYTQTGSVTFESAGYCARYAAKKLVHGEDEDHDFHPISKKSSKQAIGKSWLERYWKDAFNHGEIIIQTQESIQRCTIPRYYEKWLQKEHPEEWQHYVTETKAKKLRDMEEKVRMEKDNEIKINNIRLDQGKGLQISKEEVRKKVLEEKFNRLQSHLKGEV